MMALYYLKYNFIITEQFVNEFFLTFKLEQADSLNT